MILKASRRGGSKQLAEHLLNGVDNEHVSVHEVRGFMTDKLGGALNEIYAHARANTRIKKHLFSMSINPPKGKIATQADMIAAADEAEKRLGLTGQPRVVVFHEKRGRHAHVVWSRVDDNVKAIKLDYFKRTLTDLSRELYLKHGWDLPKGLQNKQDRNRTNYDLSEHQAAKRHKLNPKAIKSAVQACWHQSDDADSFKNALEQQGYQLAKGDKRSFVIVDGYGEVRSLSRTLSVKVADIKAKLGESHALQTVADAKTAHAQSQKTDIRQIEAALKQKHEAELAPINAEFAALNNQHKQARQALDNFHQARQIAERQARQAQYQKGLKGLWHFVTGRYHKQKQRHEAEYEASLTRDTQEKETLIQSQLKARENLQHTLDDMRSRHQTERIELMTQQLGNTPEMAMLAPEYTAPNQSTEWTL